MIAEIVEISALPKKSEYALICLFIFYLLHNLFVLIHVAKIRKLSELLGNKKQYGDNLL